MNRKKFLLTLQVNTLENQLNLICVSALIANYLLNFLSFTKTFCYNGVPLFILFSNYHFFVASLSDKGLNFLKAMELLILS